MKKLFIPTVFIIILGLLLFSCQKSTDLLNPKSDQQKETGELAKGNPHKDKPDNGGGADKQPPQIVALYVDEDQQQSGVSLPGEVPAKIFYHVTDDVDIERITISLVYDFNDDGQYHIVLDRSVFYESWEVPGKSDTDVKGTFEWDGSVDYSGSGFLFDQFATNNSDPYLVKFSVEDKGGHVVSNAIYGNDDDLYVGVSANQIIPVNPTESVSEFHVENITAVPSPTSKKYKKYAAKLEATIKCNVSGFNGTAQWVQVFEDGTEGAIEKREGCPNVMFQDDDGDESATPNSAIYVGAGTYRLYVKTLYHPEYSYDPNEHENWNWNNKEEPYVEIQVEK